MADIEFFGETFTLAEEGISEFAMLEFAEAASSGVDGDTMQGMAAMKRLVQDCVDPDDWGRFAKLARAKRAKVADLMPVIQACMEAQAGRPTGRPSDSSDGPVSIPEISGSTLDERVTERFPGRPDIQAGVLRMAKSAASG